MYSFKDWCINNNLEGWLELWDFDLNHYTPDQVAYRSNKYYYFKCNRGLHSSHRRRLNVLTRNANSTNLFCKHCNSFGQWLLDTYGRDAINSLWSCKNIISPFEVSRCSSDIVYLRCINGKHEDYPERPCDFVRYRHCPICNNKRVLRGFNDVATTHPETLHYFNDANDAYTHTWGSRDRVLIKCPVCGHLQLCNIVKVINGEYRCQACSDGISFANKFIMCFLSQILNQTNINFYFEKIFDWSRNLNIHNNNNKEMRRYDFYIEHNDGIIIEAHGRQHYEDGFGEFDGGRTLDDEIENDQFKKILALSNGIRDENYVVLDCRYSTLDHIRSSIMNSILPDVLNFNEKDVDWDLCVEMAMKSNVSRVVELWNSGVRNYTELAKRLHVARVTIYEYLRTAASIGLCDYVVNEKSVMKSKPIICENNGFIFASAIDFEKNSEQIFGRYIPRHYVYNAIRNKKQQDEDVLIRQISYEEFVDTQTQFPNRIFGDIILFKK
jgi:hypothetical protein